MGQKTHPKSFRLALRKDWSSRWFAKHDSDFRRCVLEDFKIRKIINNQFAKTKAMISNILINRYSKSIEIVIQTARPGMVIGKNGETIEALKTNLKLQLKKDVDIPLNINIEEVRSPELNAKITAVAVSQQIERRVAFRKAMKRSMQSAIKFGALGVKIKASGRLNGIEIARSEWYKEGSIPLHTLSADIDYDVSEAHTTYGIIGIKVWIYKGPIKHVVYSQGKVFNKTKPASRRETLKR